MDDKQPPELPEDAKPCEKRDCPWKHARHFHVDGWVLAPGEFIW